MKKETMFALAVLIVFAAVYTYVSLTFAGSPPCTAFAVVQRPIGSQQLYPEFNAGGPLEQVILSECGDGIVRVSIGEVQPQQFQRRR